MTNPVYTSTRFQPVSINGVPLAGAVLHFFEAGTSTPITVYADQALTTPLGSTVTADGSGTFQPIYMASQVIKTQLYDVNGVLQPNGTIDNVSLGQGDGTIILKQSANPTPTAEGDIQWDTDDNRIAIGGGGSTVTFSNDATNAANFLSTSSVASVAQYRANTAGKIVGTNSLATAGSEVALTFAATIAVDMSTFINGSVSMAGNATLGNPSNTIDGRSGRIRFIQDATGSRTLSYAANWVFAGGVDPVLTTTANAYDILYYDVISSSLVFGSLNKAIG